MKAAVYQIERDNSINETTQRLRDGGWSAKPIAGGQSLGAMLNLRLAQPEILVDLDTLAELRMVTESTHSISFGAMTTHAQIEDRTHGDPSRGLMPQVARGIAYRAVRNRGTIGGSLCHADPAADWVNAMPLLGASLVLQSADGKRQVPAAQFMISAFETQLADGELLAQIVVPRRSSAARWAYRKYCRKTGEFANALASCLLDPADGTERIVLGALDGAPHVVDQPGLIATLHSDAARRQWLQAQDLGVDTTRYQLLDEMLRLALMDMDIAR